MLDPFRKYRKKSDEEVNIKLVRQRSHDHFTYYKPLPKDFDRHNVLPPYQMKLLKDTAAKIKARKKYMQMLLN